MIQNLIGSGFSVIWNCKSIVLQISTSEISSLWSIKFVSCEKSTMLMIWKNFWNVGSKSSTKLKLRNDRKFNNSLSFLYSVKIYQFQEKNSKCLDTYWSLFEKDWKKQSNSLNKKMMIFITLLENTSTNSKSSSRPTQENIDLKVLTLILQDQALKINRWQIQCLHHKHLTFSMKRMVKLISLPSALMSCSATFFCFLLFLIVSNLIPKSTRLINTRWSLWKKLSSKS